MKKVLFCASTFSHIRSFHLPYLQAFRERGWEVWVAAGGKAEEHFSEADHVVSLPFCKRFFSPRNLLAIWRFRALQKREGFAVLSIHTTLAGAVCRAAMLWMRNRPRIFYTCHGYLFGEEGGLRKWAYLLPEKICAPVTDTLMVMNQEDLSLAKKHRLFGKNLREIPGMGFDRDRFSPLSPASRQAKREAMGAQEKDVLFLYAAEFSARKNQTLLLQGFAQALPQMPHARLLLAGDGALLSSCKALAEELGLTDRVKFLGHVSRMDALYPLCDAVVSPSRIEGLPFHMMEAMSCGLPAVATKIKGHRELITEGETGLFFPLEDAQKLSDALRVLYDDPARRAKMGAAAREKVAIYSLEQVKPQVLAAYEIEKL